MKISNAARLIFWVTAIFAIGILVRAESGEKRANAPNRKSAPPLRIVDQNGRPAVSGVPAGGGQIFDVAVGQGGDVFVPDTVNISVGDTVRWTWAEGGHSVTSGDLCTADGQFCSPNNTNCGQCVTSNQGFVYEFTFTQAGSFSYFCCVHCAIGMTGVVNVSGGACSWAAGSDLPQAGARFVGVFFPANGKFYVMGGRDVNDVEFTNPFEYDPMANTWTTKSASYPDGFTNNMACSVLNDSGTDYIYCTGGSNFASQTTSGRVFRYEPIADVITSVSSNWPPGDAGILPGGFSVFNNTFVILGGFDIPNGVGTDQIWQFTPSPAGWMQKNAVLPVPLGYIPTTTIGSLIYTGGGADITGGALTDTTNSFVYDPVADSISTIADIPRPTSNTRAVNFCNQMYVLGGAFNAPSNEVDIYDPVSNTWSLGIPFAIAGRNFAADTDGTNNIWKAGGYSDDGVTKIATTEIFNCPVSPCGTPSPTPTATATATATGSPTATATATASPTATLPPGIRPTPTPRPRPTPAPRP
jgi:plastocyanin/N-acetylneuraminic acid mutarotase